MRKVKKPNSTPAMRECFEKMLMRAEEENETKFLADHFNEWLDELLSNDYFGTEGQLDPRGDRRG